MNNRCQFTFAGPETAGKCELTPIILPFILRHVKRRGVFIFPFRFRPERIESEEATPSYQIENTRTRDRWQRLSNVSANSLPQRLKLLARRVIITRHDS